MKARHVPPDERNRLLEALRRGPKTKVKVFWIGDEETRDFALELNDILRDAAWQTSTMEAPKDMQDDLAMSGLPRGLWIVYHKSATQSAKRLQNALEQAGLTVRSKEDSEERSLDGEEVTLGVGLRQ